MANPAWRQIADAARNTVRQAPIRLTISILIPLAALAAQWALWPWVKPLVWFFFYPAIFLSARIGGLRGALPAAILSIILVWCFFAEPRLSWSMKDPDLVWSMILFFFMSWLFGHAQELMFQAHRRLERAMQENRDSYAATLHTILQTSHHAMLIVSGAGRVIEVNSQAERMFGYAPSSMLGMSVEDLVPERMRGQHLRHRAAFAADPHRQMARGRELSARRSDGGEFPADIILGPVSVQGAPHVVVTVADITERRTAEIALRRSEERLRLLYENIKDYAIIMLDPQGRVVTWNKGAQEIYDFTEEEILGQPIDRFLTPEDVAAGKPAQLLRRATAEGGCADEGWRLRRDGARFYADMILRAMCDDSGALVGYAKITRDVTERLRAETEVRRLNASLEQRVAERTAELQTANRELEAFSYSVSHDLRAPLRAIDGFSKILEQDCAAQLGEAGRDYLARIRRSAQRMGELIDDLLNLSRIGRIELTRADVDLSAQANAISDALRAASPERDAQFAIAQGMKARGDARLLRIALENLFSNAWKFTARRAPARIEFSQKEVDRETAYCIRDNGAGFDMAYAGKLFGAFQRLHDAREFPGSGIGLAIVQRIIARHGGRIWAEAEPEKGATFYFTL